MAETLNSLGPLFLLCVVIILGVVLGSVKVKGFSLESSAIIFVGMLVGHLGGVIPPLMQTMGLMLFIYSIGLQAGPGFISSFRSNGLKLSLGALVIVAIGFFATLVGALLFDYPGGIAAGVFAGSLTSSPGLAVAVEVSGPDQAPAAYGVTYVFGVIGVILFVKLTPLLLGKNIEQEESFLRETLEVSHSPMEVFHLRITNPNIQGMKVAQLNLRALAPVSITRLQRQNGEDSELVNAATELMQGDLLRVVATREDLDKVLYTIGEISEDVIPFSRALSNRRILVSKKELTGRTIGSLNLRMLHNVTISRFIRNGVEFPPTSTVKVQMGDRLTLVGSARALDKVEKTLGNDVESTYKTDAIVIVVGLALGFLIGSIPFNIPALASFSLGLAGGTLASGLILGALYNTGPLVWVIPVPSNEFIRNIGLYMFLSVVGVSAGSTIVATIEQQGVELLAFGVCVTILTLLLGCFICSRLLKIPFLQMLGVMTGGMTSTPGLAAGTPLSNTQFMAAAYATVYPVAMIAMIIFSKLLVSLV